MHELALMQGIISIVNSEAKKQGFQICSQINIKMGEYSGVIPECLRECFPLAAKGSPAEKAVLNIETVKAEFQCPSCSYSGPLPQRTACCPNCGGTAIKMIAGREFYVESLKVE